MTPNHDDARHLKAAETAMLLAIGSGRRDNTPLSPDQEWLLDRWIAGELSEAEVAQAVDLVKSRNFAAERVLERLLVTAADLAPAVPAALSSRILASLSTGKHTRQVKSSRGSLFSLHRWQLRVAGLALASLAIAAVASYRFRGYSGDAPQRIQVAMVSIDDHAPWSRTRTRTVGDAAWDRNDKYYDIDVPADVLRRTLAVNSEQSAAVTQLLSYLPTPGGKVAAPSQILVDSAVADRLAVDWRGRSNVPVRVYRFDEGHAQRVRGALKVAAGSGPLTLVTVQPASGSTSVTCNGNDMGIVYNMCRIYHAYLAEPAARVETHKPLG